MRWGGFIIQMMPYENSTFPLIKRVKKAKQCLEQEQGFMKAKKVPTEFTNKTTILSDLFEAMNKTNVVSFV